MLWIIVKWTALVANGVYFVLIKNNGQWCFIQKIWWKQKVIQDVVFDILFLWNADAKDAIWFL